MDNLYEIEIEVKTLIEQITEHYLPILRSTLSTLDKILTVAKQRRIQSLALKTSATVFGTLATGLSIVGVMTVVGATVILPSAIFLSTYGAIASVGISIADIVIQRKDIKKVEKKLSQICVIKEKLEDELDQCFKIKTWLRNALGIYEKKKTSPILTQNDLNFNDKRFVSRKIKTTHFDKEIDVNDIRAGDHIFRKLNGPIVSELGFHHGVALGKDEDGVEKVAEFGMAIKRIKSENMYTCQIVSLDRFMGAHKRCHKRHYIGDELEIYETLDIAKQICCGDRQWDTYNLFGNNCEHFATFLKLKQPWSGQISTLKGIKNTAIQKIPVTSRAAVLAVRAAQVSDKGIAQIVAKLAAEQGPMALSVAYKVGVEIGSTILTVADIAVLIYDWKKKRPNIDKIETSIKYLENELATYVAYLNLLYFVEESISVHVGPRRKYKKLKAKGK